MERIHAMYQLPMSARGHRTVRPSVLIKEIVVDSAIYIGD